jgi:hypothetical protein
MNDPNLPKLLTEIELLAERAELMETINGLVWQFAFQGHNKKGKWLSTGGLSALEDAFAVLKWEDPHYIREGGCQHPECKAWDTCGTPTPDGYKRLCGEHYRLLRAKMDAEVKEMDRWENEGGT